MSDIYVQSSSAIEDVIDQLMKLNLEFRQKAGDIRAEHKTLTTKWTGDASTAFQEHFRDEEPNFEAFAIAVDEYVQGLRQILEEYETAESTNIDIAST